MKIKKNTKYILLWISILLASSVVYHAFHKSRENIPSIMVMSEFEKSVQNGSIKSVEINERFLHAFEKGGGDLLVQHGGKESFGRIERLLSKNNVGYAFSLRNSSSTAFLGMFLHAFLPIILFFLSWFFLFRHVQSRSGRGMGMGMLPNKKKNKEQKKKSITFRDVEGLQDAKESLSEIVDFLKKPSKFREIGARIPRGALLIGPPGTGKTLLARAVAGEANVPFFSISGSDFVEMFVGVGAGRVRELFGRAKQESPCIIFIDEIDAVGRKRGASGMGGGHDEREQTLNALLVEMDGFESKEDVIVLASTNRADILDNALLRPGRFDRQISVDLPDIKGRESILNLYLKKIKHKKTIIISKIARGTPGFSGAELESLVNESAILAVRKGKKKVEQKDMEESRDKIIMGPERKTLSMTEEERKITAYHEAGHAVVAFHSPHSDPIYKATIVPRGNALGMVIRLPENDRVSISRKRLLDDLAVALGGRVSEELVFGSDSVTTGASSDFQFATSIAKRMVTEWGMSDVTGLVSYKQSQDGASFWDLKGEGHSEETLLKIDGEVRKIIDKALQHTTALLKKHYDQLEKLAKELLEKETLSGEEIKALLEKESAKKTEQKNNKGRNKA